MMLQKLMELVCPSRRPPRACEACDKAFVCGASFAGCWCFDIKLDAAIRNSLRAKYKNCLCRECLEASARQDAESGRQ